MGGGPSPQVLASGPLIEDGGFTSRSLDSLCIGCSGAPPQPSESTHATMSLGGNRIFSLKTRVPGGFVGVLIGLGDATFLCYFHFFGRVDRGDKRDIGDAI